MSELSMKITFYYRETTCYTFERINFMQKIYYPSPHNQIKRFSKIMKNIIHV